MVTIPAGDATFCKVSESFVKNCGRNRVSKTDHTQTYKQTEMTNILRKIYFFRSNKLLRLKLQGNGQARAKCGKNWLDVLHLLKYEPKRKKVVRHIQVAA